MIRLFVQESVPQMPPACLWIVEMTIRSKYLAWDSLLNDQSGRGQTFGVFDSGTGQFVQSIRLPVASALAPYLSRHSVSLRGLW
jgi:hypothetical protein